MNLKTKLEKFIDEHNFENPNINWNNKLTFKEAKQILNLLNDIDELVETVNSSNNNMVLIPTEFFNKLIASRNKIGS